MYIREVYKNVHVLWMYIREVYKNVHDLWLYIREVYNNVHDLWLYIRDMQGCVAYYVAGLAVGLLVHGVEGLAAQLGSAGHADEAVHVEHLVHGGAASALAHHVLSAAGTATWRQGGTRMDTS